MLVVVVGLMWNRAASLEDSPKVPSSVVVRVTDSLLLRAGGGGLEEDVC